MCSALKTCVSLALCQPANADLNLAAGDVFFFFMYIVYRTNCSFHPKLFAVI